jgi:cyclic-di-AMP phosphodiesterase PgpH
MFADGVEACARAERPANDEQLRTLVQKVIDSRQKSGQLEDTPLSQRDLAAIVDSFVSTLRVTYHPRLEYPSEPVAPVEPVGAVIQAENIK